VAGASPSRWRSLARWGRGLLRILAVAYPVSLVATALVLRYVGEAWWVSTVGLYLPRLGFALPLPFIALGLHQCRMRRLLALQGVGVLTIVFPLMGFVPPWPNGHGDGPTVRVLSFNVNSGHSGIAVVMDQIGRYSPDVVLLQETGGNAGLVPPLKALYPTVEVSGQFVMASRYTLAPSTDVAMDPTSAAPEHDSFQRRVLDTPLGRIVVYDVHTLSPRAALFGLRGKHGLRGEITSGRLFRGDGAPSLEGNASHRAAEVEAVVEAAAKETDPVILAGDTNLPGLSPVLHRFLSTYDDGFARAGWGFGYTFPTDKWRPWMRIDRIMTNAPLRFVRFEVGDVRDASDHLCVVADLQRAAR
jgi:endonuclease/exonuclease/phosphatase (EEP) superfamily protein YafD